LFGRIARLGAVPVVRLPVLADLEIRHLAKKAKSKKNNNKKVENQSGGEITDPAPEALQPEQEGSENERMPRKDYEKELKRMQIELVRLQSWVKYTGARIVVVFEGRDAAGKGGIIKRMTERVSPRVFRVVALPVPSDREKTQMYVQRYMAHMPAAGEIVIFDRSWYNRAGVERVLGFCEKRETEKFLRNCDRFEYSLVSEGIKLVKYWLAVGKEEQLKRFRARIEDPLRQWKLSPTDLESVRLWYEYSIARDSMFAATDTDFAPWHIVRANDKRRARLNCIRHFLESIPYEDVPVEAVEIPECDTTHAYNDEATLSERRFVKEYY
jgi:polyphosphate kinase 2